MAVTWGMGQERMRYLPLLAVTGLTRQPVEARTSLTGRGRLP